MVPGGVRVGAPAMTSRGANEDDFRQIGEFLHRVVAICLKIQGRVGTKLTEFTKALESEEDLVALRSEVETFASRFRMPGVIN